MAYPKAIVEQAGHLYCSGETSENLCRVLKVNPRIFWHWVKKYGWEKGKPPVKQPAKLQIQEKITQKITQDTVDWVKRHAEIGQQLQQKGMAKILPLDTRSIRVDEALKMVEKGIDAERKAWTLGKEENPQQTINILNLIKISGELDE